MRGAQLRDGRAARGPRPLTADRRKEDAVEREPSPESTFALLARHRAGDAAAIETLVARYYPRVERMVRVRLGATLRERETVADVVQDVFVRVIEGLEGYERRPDARWVDWVVRLAQNEISNHARRDRAKKRGGAIARQVQQHAESAATLDIPAGSTEVHARVARREAAQLVDRCLGDLSEPHREVILLRDYAGADWKDIAEKLQRPSPEACQELYRRARNDLGDRVRRRVG